MPNEKLAITNTVNDPIPNQIVQSNQNTPWWHTPISAFIGGAGGGFACFFAEGLKKRSQSNQPISLASFYPKELLRGSTSFALSVGTTSVAQFTLKRLLKNLPSYDDTSATWNVATAIASGMCGALFSTVVENIILQQQLTKSTPSKAISTLVKQGYVRPWLGLPELMVREGGFALTMLYLACVVSEHLKAKYNNEAVSHAGEIGVGVFGAFFTHPFDTMATYKQKNLTNTRTALKDLYAQNGFSAFYKGVGYRAMLFTGCMLIIPYLENKSAKALQDLSLFSSKQREHQQAQEIKMLKTLEEQKRYIRTVVGHSHS